MSDALNWATYSAAIASWVRGGSGLDDAHVWWAYEKRPRPPSAPYIVMNVQRVGTIGHDWFTDEANVLVLPTIVVTAINPGADTLTAPNHGLANGDGPIRISSSGTVPAPLQIGTDYWAIVVDANTLKLADSYVHTGGALTISTGNPVTPINLTTAGTGTIVLDGTADTVPAGQEIKRTAQGFREVVVHMECIAQDGGGYDAVRIMTNVMASLQLFYYDLEIAGVGVTDFGAAFSQGRIESLEGHRGSILEPRAMADFTFYAASNMVGFNTIIESLDATVRLKNEAGVDLPTTTIHVDDP